MLRRKRKDCCTAKPFRKCFVKTEVVKKYITVRYDPVIEKCCKRKKKVGCKEIPCKHVPHKHCKPCKRRKYWR